MVKCGSIQIFKNIVKPIFQICIMFRVVASWLAGDLCEGGDPKVILLSLFPRCLPFFGISAIFPAVIFCNDGTSFRSCVFREQKIDEFLRNFLRKILQNFFWEEREERKKKKTEAGVEPVNELWNFSLQPVDQEDKNKEASFK